jgi:hypothetical protein
MSNSIFGTGPNQVPRNSDLGPLAYLRPEDLELGVLHVRDEKAAGTAGGTNVAADFTQTRTLNTVVTNTIIGASLASDTVTLPAGTYDFFISAPAMATNGHQAALYNVTASSYTRIGTMEFVGSGAGGQTSSVVRGRFTINAPAAFKVRHWTSAAVTTIGLGNNPNSGQVNVFTEAIFRKVMLQ